jgi:hypothetical protein
LMNVRVTMMDMELEFAIHQMTGKQLWRQSVCGRCGSWVSNTHKPCHALATPCQKGFRLCLSHLVYTVQLCLIHKFHAICRVSAELLPCRSENEFSKARHITAGARHGTCELAFNVMVTSRVHVPHDPLPRLHSATSLLFNIWSIFWTLDMSDSLNRFHITILPSSSIIVHLCA